MGRSGKFFIAGLNAYLMNQELPRAEQYIRKYLGQEPEPDMPSHAAARWRLGQVLEKQNRKPEAIAEYQAAVQMDASSPGQAGSEAAEVAAFVHAGRHCRRVDPLRGSVCDCRHGDIRSVGHRLRVGIF